MKIEKELAQVDCGADVEAEIYSLAFKSVKEYLDKKERLDFLTRKIPFQETLLQIKETEKQE